MQKFKTTCMNCGSDNCEITYDVKEDYDYVWDGEDEYLDFVGLEDNGLTFSCLDCGNKYNSRYDSFDE